jgi:S-adenosylmethionine:tRNA ribosyltransferase-isomerase
MQTSDFNYDLPQELIAQNPIEPRNASRLMVLDRNDKSTSHHLFKDLALFLKPNDLLVLNNSRVLPARLFGTIIGKQTKIELLLLSQKETDVWEVLVKPGKKAKAGTRIIFEKGLLEGEVLCNSDDGTRLVKFFYNGLFYPIIENLGKVPLPPYIKEELKNAERYQTVYSKELGSSAAPTAGLHFTKEMLDDLRQKGISIEYVTLHVGLGTFRPVKSQYITEHKMHAEHYFLPERTAEAINRTKNSGGRVIAVGTTGCRTLETAGINGMPLTECEGNTDIFIYPGFEFKVIDGLITNFHLPESTLIMLVSALAGKKRILDAYKEAVMQKYRFFSFGDAMLII